MAKLSYAVIVESGDGNFSAYAPDLPGCIAVGDTVEETLQRMREALEFHLEGLREEGMPIPPPTSIGRQLELDLPAA
jgi:predicted RNase H-like HicB family nuclease